MRSKKTSAALSAAGMLWVAGCSGGALHNGAFHPTVPGGTTQSGIPANSPKVTLSFNIPTRPAAQQAKQRNSAMAKGRTTVASTTSRTPKYISPAVVGGTVVVKIYQNGAPAFPDQTLQVGILPGSAVYCHESEGSVAQRNNPAAAARRTPAAQNRAQTMTLTSCQNNAAVFAPLGSDTFFVEMYDAAQNLLSVTPGIPGTNFYGTAPSPVNVQPYGTYVTANTAGIVAQVWTNNPTACESFSHENNYSNTQIEFLDADGYQILGPFANPVGLSLPTTNGWGIYDYGSQVGTYDTIYEDLGNEFVFQTGSVAVTATVGAPTSVTGGLPINVHNLYSVDHIAWSINGGNLSALGLVNGQNVSFQCGNAPMMLNAATASPVRFTNGSAIGHDDSVPLLAVVDSTASGPVVDVIQIDDFGQFSQNYSGITFTAIPVQQVPIGSGAGPFEVAVSPVFSGGHGKIYVTNAGANTVSVVDDSDVPFGLAALYVNSFGVYNGLSNPLGLDVFVNGSDTLFVASGNTPSLTEIDNANSGGSVSQINLTGMAVGGNYFSSSVVTSAVAVDSSTSNVVIAGFDSGLSGNKAALIQCNANPGNCSGSLHAIQAASTAFAPGALSIYGSGLAVAPIGTSIMSFNDNGGISPFGTFQSGLSASPSRLFSSSDFDFTGAFFPTALSASIFPGSGGSSVGSLLGSRFTISTFY